MKISNYLILYCLRVSSSIDFNWRGLETFELTDEIFTPTKPWLQTTLHFETQSNLAEDGLHYENLYPDLRLRISFGISNAKFPAAWIACNGDAIDSYKIEQQF